MPGRVNVSGSASVYLDESSGTYSFHSAAVSLLLNGGSPVTLSLSAQSGNWSSAATWGSGGSLAIFFDSGFTTNDYTNGVQDTPSLLSWQYATSANALSSSGPSDGLFSIDNILSTSGTTPFGVPLSYSATLSLLYDVTVPDAVSVVVDQPNVTVDSLTIGATGTLSASAGAFTVENGVSGGTLQALNGGTVYLSGYAAGVTLTGTGSGVFGLYAAVLSNAAIAGGSVQVASGQSARLDGTIANSGTIVLLGAASASGFSEIQVGTATVTGSGTIALSGPGDNRLNGSTTLPAASLVNQGNTIAGHGTVGNSRFSFANHGLLDSTSGGNVLQVVTTGTLDNSGGTMQAESGAYLDLQGTAVAGGLIQAADQGTVYLEQTVANATLASSGSGALEMYSGTLAGDSLCAGSLLQVASGHHAQLAGTLINQGTVALRGSSAPNGLAELQIVGTATLSGGGTIALTGPGNSTIDDNGAAATLINSDNKIVGSGTLSGAHLALNNQGVILANVSNQTLTLGTVTNTGTVGASDGGTLIAAGLIGAGSVTVEANSKVELQGGLGAQSLFLTGPGAVLQWDNPAASLGSLCVESGQTIELLNVLANTVTYAAGQLSFTPLGGSAITITMLMENGATGVQTVVTGASSAELLTLCFCAGTRIATPRGEVPVEHLAEGDLVLTCSGETKPIVWLGAGRVLATRGRRGAATPIVVRKGALADNVPHHDLRLTKGHSLYLDGALIPVEFLVNHRSILWDDRAQEVTLYHVEVIGHDVLLANGVPAESYRDDGNRWLFRNANSVWHLPPQAPFAPVLTGGPLVDAVWRRLLERAGPRPGFVLTDEPDLHLLCDGRRLDGIGQLPGAYVFRLAQRHAHISIASRAGSPAELGLVRDPRLLGVALRRVTLQCGWRCRVLEAADTSLCNGFHGFEPELGLRWTNGEGVLPDALFAGLEPPMELVLHVSATTQYPLLTGQALQDVA